MEHLPGYYSPAAYALRAEVERLREVMRCEVAAAEERGYAAGYSDGITDMSRKDDAGLAVRVASHLLSMAAPEASHRRGCRTDPRVQPNRTPTPHGRPDHSPGDGDGDR